MNIVTIIENSFNSFHKVEKKIASYILKNKKEVVYMSIGELAKKTDVAESSIVRFCKTLGIEGFKQLKIDMAKNLENPQDVIFEDINRNDTTEDVVQKVFNTGINTLRESLETIDIRQLKKGTKALRKASRIEFYGVGTSATIAKDAYYRFMRIGFPAYYANDPHISRISASKLDEDSLAIGISYKGQTIDTIKALEIAKGAGAKTMCITSFAKSPIVKISDIKLIVSTSESRLMREAISSRIAQMVLLDCLYALCALSDFDNVLEHIESMTDILGTVRY